MAGRGEPKQRLLLLVYVLAMETDFQDHVLGNFWRWGVLSGKSAEKHLTTLERIDQFKTRGRREGQRAEEQALREPIPLPPPHTHAFFLLLIKHRTRCFHT